MSSFQREAKKLAVVLSVTKDRDSSVVLREALALEKALIYAGYDLWFYGGRESIDAYPVTAKKQDFDTFARYFNEKKEELRLQGVFIFITYPYFIYNKLHYMEMFQK